MPSSATWSSSNGSAACEPCRKFFKVCNQLFEGPKIGDCGHGRNLQTVENGNEVRVSDDFGQGVRLPYTARGPFHRTVDIRLQLCVRDAICPPHVGDAKKHFSVDCIPENMSRVSGMSLSLNPC